MKAKKKGLWIGLCGFFATLALAIGISVGNTTSGQNATIEAAASSGTPTISMLPGASVRKVEGTPGIKFTAKIDNYSTDYQYGMLILPQDAVLNLGWEDGTTDYIEALEELGVSYANESNCLVYTDVATGEKRISFALTNLYDENFALNLVGIPYTYKKGTSDYNYAEINVMEDARSISYVASMALKYETDLTQANVAFLEKYASGNLDIDQDGYFDDMTGGGSAIITPAQYEIKYTFNAAGESVALQTSQAYASGSKVSFKYFIPAGTVTSWWGVAWSTGNTGLDIYNAADPEKAHCLSKATGSWTSVEFTIPAGGPYYLYFGSEVGTAHGRWMLNGKNSYALIKDFKIGDQEHTVGANGTSEMFTMNSIAASLIKVSDMMGSFVGAPIIDETNYMLGFNAGAIGSAENIAMITNNAYAGVTEITFKAVWTGNATSARWGLSYTSDPSKFAYDGDSLGTTYINCYSPRFGEMKMGAGVEYAYRLTITGGKWEMYADAQKIGGGDYVEGNNYFYFMVCPTVSGEGAVFYIDDFAITYGGNTVTDTFANQKSTLFVESATKNAAHGSSGMVFEESTFENGEEVEPEVPEAPEESGEIAMKYIFNKGDSVSHITKEAYPGGSTISFKYYIPEGTKTQWFRLSYTDGTPDFYDSPFSLLSLSVGAWTNMTYTLPAGGPYKIFFAAESGNWTAGSYMLIDDFTVGDVKENFNCGIDNSIFSITDKNIIGEGEGYVKTNDAAKITIDLISSTASTPSFITSQKYVSDGTLVVSFDYYMSGNTNSKWWAFFWTNNNKVADIYAHVGSNKANNDGRDLPTGVQDQWATASVTIPAGEWYFYIAGAVGEWSGGYVIIDNFKIGNQAFETFDNGVNNYGIFLDNRDSKPDAVTTLVGGGIAPVLPEVPEVPEESGITGPNSLAKMLENGKILEFLASGGYAYFYAKNGSIPTGDKMPASMLRLEGVISYAFEGEKEFAIYFGSMKYLYVSEARVALYNGTELLAEREVSMAKGKIRIAVSAGNILTVSLNGHEALVTALEKFNEIKLVGLGGDGSVTFDAWSFTTYTCNTTPLAEVAPVYLSAEKLDITAYAFDSEAMISDEGFQLLADAGFTKTMALLQGRISGLAYTSPSQAEVERLMAEVNADALAALELAEKYGLKHYVFNEGLYNVERHSAWNEYMDEIADASSYTLSSAFAGHFFADEPYIGYTSSGSFFNKKYTYDPTVQSADGSSLAKLVESYRAYRAAFPDSEAYINLNPRYDTDGGTSKETNLQIYKDYVDYYVENIALDKDGVKGTGFVSVDIYPLKTTGLNAMHLWNLEYIAKKCRDNNLEMRIYIQATERGNAAYKVAATKTVNDFMLQIYSALAYGAKEIVYYQFTDHSEYNTDDTKNSEYAKDNYQDALINGQDLTCYNAYYLAKEVNGHVGALSSAYMNFTWKSASVFGKTGITQFNNLESKASAYGVLSSVSSSASVLVGNFDDADGKYTYNAQYGYMVVNYGNTQSSQETSSVTMTFNGTPNKVLVYQKGVASVVKLNSNALTLNLELGEGAFVIPFNA